MIKFISRALRAFRKNQKGSLSVEAVIAIPMLFWAATATFTFFDAFKAQGASYRANYTISDMLSRETAPITQNYIDGIHTVFRYMTESNAEDSWIRISQVTCNAQCTDETNRDMSFVWSKGVGGASDLDDDDMPFYESRIPLMAFGSNVVLVETSRQYIPPFANLFLTGFAGRDLLTDVVTRPRFASQLCWVTLCGTSGGSDAPDD